MEKQVMRIIIEVISGILISVIISFVLISLGYYTMNKLSIANYTQTFMSVPIYKIVKHGNNLNGSPLINNLLIIGIICSVISVFIGEMIFYIKKGKKHGIKK